MQFKDIPQDLYRLAEPEAGEVLPPLTGRMKSRRPREEFLPDWSYLSSGKASTIAVVAGLFCGLDVPEHVWQAVLENYCPRAWALLSAAGVSFEQWNAGRCEAVLCSEVAATANAELGGYAVFAVMDVPGMTAEIIATLGQVPRFE